MPRKPTLESLTRGTGVHPLLSDLNTFMTINTNDLILIAEYGRIMEHEKWSLEIPTINFPSDWAVKITPPMTGAVVRFRVFKDKAEVSIYLDCYDKLGCFGSPYWEVYPYSDDVFRCKMQDIESLLDAIRVSIRQQNEG